MLIQLLTSHLPSLNTQNTKVHLAQHNGIDHPMDVYLAGEFDDWQSRQSRRNFECEYVIGLVELPGTKKWLLAGVYDSLKLNEAKSDNDQHDLVYDYRRVPEFAELEGRLILDYSKPRGNYLWLETCLKSMVVSSLLERPMTVGKFPGFKEVDISHRELNIIVKQGLESWQTALSSVAGVYLISDRTEGEHQLYVGSATGTGGVWDRWVTYAHNGHGGNIRLRDLHARRGETFAENFRFSILEIADKHTDKEEMMQKEIHWKRRLLTRDSGLNGN
ncbi:GIY-YIG nuclease family protein [Pseudomonas saponiphila]|uniref:GIY-YIG nuclease family protein n=1 Tax=Pseudomonas saponiphila TaxID=556534 RepID=UPI00224073F9|nr:GIY-YIG nuclease family protein [Pseudomonas saponiphila]